MADIAQLGFAVDTSGLSNAKQKLDALSPSAARAGQTTSQLTAKTDALGNAAQRAAVGIQEETGAAVQAAAGFTKAGSAADIAAGKIKRMHGAANDNAGAFKANTANIAAQFQDIGVTAAMGMSPLQIALQQGTQLSAVFAASGENAAKTIATAFGSLITPTALLTIGIVALVAAGLQMVDWASLAKSALNTLASGIEIVAPAAAIAAAALALMYAPAIIAGLVAVTTTIVQIGVAALVTGARMAAAWIAGMGPIGWVVLGIAAIGTALYVFRDQINAVLGVDLFGIVKTGANYIVGGFVGAYKALVATWRQLPAAFGDLAVQAGNALISCIEKAINFVTLKVQRFWNGIANLDPTGTLGKANFDTVTLPKIVNPNKGAAAGALSDAAAAAKSAMGVDYLGGAYKAVGNAASWASDKVRNLAGAIDLTDKASKKRKGQGGKTDGEKFEDIVKGAERSIASLQAERAAVGLSDEATARLKYETQLLNEAQQKNINLTPQQRNQLMGLAGDMASLEVATAKAKDQLGFSKDLFKGFIDDIASGLKEGQSFWKSFGDAALNVLDKISDKLLNDVIDALFQVKSAASGKSGGFLGALGGLFGGGSTAAVDPWAGLRMAKGGAFANGISGHSNSVVTRPTPFMFASGAGIMGEAGPEGILPLARMGNGDLGVQMRTGNGKSEGGDVYVEYAPSYTVEAGATQEAVAELRKIQDEDRRNFQSNVENAIGDLRMRASDV